ncbi:MAG: virulence RhuM family protein [Pedobacter sp.]|nr:virulence RhuM family protein [Pedobacter sp.]
MATRADSNKNVIVAKNYLNKEELDGLNRIVIMYLDYAENQAKKGTVTYITN